MSIFQPLQFVGDADFQLAVAGGAAAAVVALVAGRRRASAGRPVPLAGLAFAVPAGVIIATRLEMPEGVVVGLIVLGIGGALADLGDVPLPLALLVAGPGAWMLAWHGELVPVTWIRWAIAGVTLLGGAAFASFDRRFARSGYPPAFFALSTVGVYYTVPDPYEAIVLMGCVLPVAFLGWPRPVARFGASGALMAVGLMAWAVGRGGFGRQSSIIGGLASLGLLALEPCWRAFQHRAWSPLDALPRGAWRWPLAIGVQLACVYVASRVVGLRDLPDYQAPGPLWRGRIAGALLAVGAGVAAASAAAWVAHLAVRPGSGGRARPDRRCP